MLFLLLIILGVLFVITLFSSSRFSPVPYYPTNKKDMPLIIKGLALKNNQTIVDFGAGDGVVIFEAAMISFKQKLNTRFVAVEINPILVFILHFRRLFHPNKKNVQIVYGDIFKLNFDQLTTNHQSQITIYLYISPWLIDQLIKNCLPLEVLSDNRGTKWGKLKIENFSVVSYMYPVKLLKNKEKIIQGLHNIYVYN